MAADAKRALVLVSGGLDSATVLSIARQQGFAVYALSFDYGQRHAAELQAAAAVVAAARVELHRVVQIDLSQLGGSALTDDSIDVPTSATPDMGDEGIPITYVPARNTVFLSFALAWAEVLGCHDIFIGVNAVDYSGYPDCRPEFIAAFEQMANLATKIGVEGEKITIHTPLIDLRKSDIIRQGHSLGVDYALTVSCYQADATGAACGICASCHIRRQGFADAEVADPTRYQ
ncbi:MAG: 7-cyano-7-deazaguanine synthase QueC [Pseudomonadota bacterium]